MLICFGRLEDVCSRHGRFIPADDIDILQRGMEGALLLYNQLAAEAITQDKKLWSIVPKHHMATHLAYDFAPLANPRHVHCYSDEDMVGRMKS